EALGGCGQSVGNRGALVVREWNSPRRVVTSRGSPSARVERQCVAVTTGGESRTNRAHAHVVGLRRRGEGLFPQTQLSRGIEALAGRFHPCLDLKRLLRDTRTHGIRRKEREFGTGGRGRSTACAHASGFGA